MNSTKKAEEKEEEHEKRKFLSLYLFGKRKEINKSSL